MASSLAASRLTLGRSLHALGRTDDAVTALRQALGDARALGHPPSIWPAAAALAVSLEQAGDDAGAEDAARLAQSTLEEFAAGLSATRRERFMASPHLRASLERIG